MPSFLCSKYCLIIEIYRILFVGDIMNLFVCDIAKEIVIDYEFSIIDLFQLELINNPPVMSYTYTHIIINHFIHSHMHKTFIAME